MKSQPLISVIIPTYNRENHVTKAIQSVIDQTYNNIEIIVVDDGSTDNTRNIVSTYQDKIIYIYKNNGGVSSARNIGISKAKGDYISFLDSDDSWYPEKLKKQMDYLSVNKYLAGVLCDVEFINHNNELMKVSNIRKQIPHDGIIVKYLFIKLLTMCSILTHKDVFDSIGTFDESLNTAEDIDMLLRIASRYKIGVLSEPLVQINRGSSELRKKLFTGNRLIVLKKFKQFNKNFVKQNRRIVDSAHASICLSYADDLLWNRYINDAQKQLLSSIKLCFTFKALALFLKSIIMRICSGVLKKYQDKGNMYLK